MIQRVTGLDVRPEIVARRPGDPDRLVADPELIARHMGWRGRLDLEDAIQSARNTWPSGAQSPIPQSCYQGGIDWTEIQ